MSEYCEVCGDDTNLIETECNCGIVHNLCSKCNKSNEFFTFKDLSKVLDDFKTDDSLHEWCKDNLDGEDNLVKILEEVKKRIINLWS